VFALLEDAGFTRVRSTVVRALRPEGVDARRAEGYGVKAVLFTAQKPGPRHGLR